MKPLTAKILFLNLGYYQDKHEDYIVYWKPLKLRRELQIEFNFKFKTVEKRKIPDMKSEVISLQELQAINKQVEELGW